MVKQIKNHQGLIQGVEGRTYGGVKWQAGLETELAGAVEIYLGLPGHFLTPLCGSRE